VNTGQPKRESTVPTIPTVRLFVYGTLTDPDTAAAVLETFSFEGAATVDGLHRAEGAYPTLLPGGSADGRVLETPDVERLDRYEGVDRGLYVRVSLPCEDGRTVETYVGDPGRLGIDDEWPGDGPFADRVRAYIDANDVSVSTE